MQDREKIASCYLLMSRDCREGSLAGAESIARGWHHLEVTSLTGLPRSLGLAGGPTGISLVSWASKQPGSLRIFRALTWWPRAPRVSDWSEPGRGSWPFLRSLEHNGENFPESQRHRREMEVTWMALVLPPLPPAQGHTSPQVLLWKSGLLQDTDVSSPGHGRAQGQDWKHHCQHSNLGGSSNALVPGPAGPQTSPLSCPSSSGITGVKEETLHPLAHQVGVHLSRCPGDLSVVVTGLL
ncbi:uncharacterized protein LOC129011673 isoform X1 [Pongo pygmaeus]|uniref:uncharacterized protein LOC129011673 isoform X1 n=1 Tax=Pongo pygmaeus TaxID=9600 RepID=UPI0023E1335F|nr:uncharacterized protein LOC129011673 isoform X1 [Pongo pygmaeus]XP_054302801.1 uncharacterized protein LOC129011673 isoform X1 [Pongo pygmaeus]